MPIAIEIEECHARAHGFRKKFLTERPIRVRELDASLLGDIGEVHVWRLNALGNTRRRDDHILRLLLLVAEPVVPYSECTEEKKPENVVITPPRVAQRVEAPHVHFTD